MTPSAERFVTLIDQILAGARRHAKSLLPIFVIIFLALIAHALMTAPFKLSNIDPVMLFVLVCILSPLSGLAGAINLKALASAAPKPLNLGQAFYFQNLSVVSDILPIPAAAMLKGGMLIQLGIAAGRSATLLISNAGLWIGVTAAAAGFSIGLGDPLGLTLATTGSLLSVAISALFFRWLSFYWVMVTLVTRLLGSAIIAARLMCAFACLGFFIAPAQALPFVFALVLGSVSAIAPGGLGISELLAYAISYMTDIVAGVAVLAVALDRIACLLSSAMIHLLLQGRTTPLFAATK